MSTYTIQHLLPFYHQSQYITQSCDRFSTQYHRFLIGKNTKNIMTESYMFSHVAQTHFHNQSCLHMPLIGGLQWTPVHVYANFCRCPVFQCPVFQYAWTPYLLSLDHETMVVRCHSSHTDKIGGKVIRLPVPDQYRYYSQRLVYCDIFTHGIFGLMQLKFVCIHFQFLLLSI